MNLAYGIKQAEAELELIEKRVEEKVQDAFAHLEHSLAHLRDLAKAKIAEIEALKAKTDPPPADPPPPGS